MTSLEIFNQILTGASKDLRVLVKEKYATPLPFVEQAIMELSKTIRKDFSISVLNTFCQKSREFCNHLKHSLTSKRSGKLRKLFLLQDEPTGTNTNVSSPSTTVHQLVCGVAREMTEERLVNIEDLCAVHSLSSFNPLPLDSRELMIDPTESLSSDRMSYHLRDSSCPNVKPSQSKAKTTEKDEHACDIESLFSVDQMAHFSVELGEEPNNNASPTLNTSDSLSEVAFPNEPMEDAITTD